MERRLEGKRRNLYKDHFKASMAREREEGGRKERRQGGEKWKEWVIT